MTKEPETSPCPFHGLLLDLFQPAKQVGGGLRNVAESAEVLAELGARATVRAGGLAAGTAASGFALIEGAKKIDNDPYKVRQMSRIAQGIMALSGVQGGPDYGRVPDKETIHSWKEVPGVVWDGIKEAYHRHSNQGVHTIVRMGGKTMSPDYAACKFAEDARRRARRRTVVLQVPDNKADSVKLRAPCGFKCLRIYHKFNFTFWVKAQRDKIHDNYSIIHKNYFSQAFEVHNLG